jgi:hypothetical protein
VEVSINPEGENSLEQEKMPPDSESIERIQSNILENTEEEDFNDEEHLDKYITSENSFESQTENLQRTPSIILHDESAPRTQISLKDKQKNHNLNI